MYPGRHRDIADEAADDWAAPLRDERGRTVGAAVLGLDRLPTTTAAGSTSTSGGGGGAGAASTSTAGTSGGSGSGGAAARGPRREVPLGRRVFDRPPRNSDKPRNGSLQPEGLL